MDIITLEWSLKKHAAVWWGWENMQMYEYFHIIVAINACRPICMCTCGRGTIKG